MSGDEVVAIGALAADDLVAFENRGEKGSRAVRAGNKSNGLNRNGITQQHDLAGGNFVAGKGDWLWVGGG